MTKRFWAGVMIFSLLITGAATSYVYFVLQEKAIQELTLSPPTPAPVQESLPAMSTTTTPADSAVPVQTPKPLEAAAVPNAVSESNASLRNVLFTYHNATATKVYLIGDFNNWFREPMKKMKDGMWMASVRVSPGTYKYMFVVDDKRIRDPTNERSSHDGRSVVVVKSLS